MEELKVGKAKNNSEYGKKVIRNLAFGNFTKKYRLNNYVNKYLGIRSTKSQSKCLAVQKRKRKPILKTELTNHVTDFYERDDVSRCMPGKRDAKNVEGEKKQVRILNDYLANIHENFCLEEPTFKVSYSTFCKLRPKNIKVTSLLSRNTCLCTIHQNMALKLKSLRSIGVDISPNPEVVKKLTTGEVDEKMKMIKDAEIEYEQWKRIDIEGKKKMRIVKETKTKPEFMAHTMSQFTAFIEHVSRVSHQYQTLSNIKENLPAGHVILHMDFAENFTCQSLDEIQSAYWIATPVSIHPIVAYVKQLDGTLFHRNFVFISDVLNHNATAVFAILQKAVPVITSTFPDTTRIHYWTDSPSSQYRNSFIFDIFTHHAHIFGISASWNYFEAGHGKGPCDGIGGTIKRRASEAVRQGKATIQDAFDFFKWAKGNEKSIEAHFYSTEHYNTSAQLLSQNSPKTVPGTMSLHAACPTKDGLIAIACVSCYCNSCLHGQFCGGWTEHRVSTSTNIGTEEAHEENTSFESNKDMDITDKSEVQVQPAFTIKDLAIGSYVCAKYDDDWFIGKIEEIENESELFISFLAKHIKKGSHSFNWPSRPDEVIVSLNDILCAVHEPLPGRVLQLEDDDMKKVLQVWNNIQ